MVDKVCGSKYILKNIRFRNLFFINHQFLASLSVGLFVLSICEIELSGNFLCWTFSIWHTSCVQLLQNWDQTLTDNRCYLNPCGRKWRWTKKPLDESESGEWKSWLKAQHSENKNHGIRSHHFVGNRWGNSVKLYFWGGSRITADGDCSHEIKRRLLLGRKVMANLDSILKSRDITLPTKVCLVKAMVFPVVTYGYESWTIKKAEHWRIDAFELWCWRRLLRVPWTARRSN